MYSFKQIVITCLKEIRRLKLQGKGNIDLVILKDIEEKLHLFDEYEVILSNLLAQLKLIDASRQNDLDDCIARIHHHLEKYYELIRAFSDVFLKFLQKVIRESYVWGDSDIIQ